MRNRFLVRSGNIFLNNGYLMYASQDGDYWSKNMHSAGTVAFALGFNSGALNYSYFIDRYTGYSLRCLQE